MRTLVTGGAGFIGTHLVVALVKAGHDVVVVDDFSTGSLEGLARAQVLAGAPVRLFKGDVADADVMARALEGVDVVFHLAAGKQVGESMALPEKYLLNNLGGMAALIASMQAAGVSRIVYSSSAAVYGEDLPMPLKESMTPVPSSVYGDTKLKGEQMLDWMVRLRDWRAVSLRYFNPVGAHSSGYIGEPFEKAANLVPRALIALTRPDDVLTIFGTDYDTPDGTACRDYIHIDDLAEAHIAALQCLEQPGHNVFNVGTGTPGSVREVLDACGRAAGRSVPAVEGARRPGDPPESLADPSRFQAATGWRATRDLDTMVGSAWNWRVENPDGYKQSKVSLPASWEDEVVLDGVRTDA